MSQQEVRMMSQEEIGKKGFTVNDDAFVINKNGDIYKDANGYDYVLQISCTNCGKSFCPNCIDEIFCSDNCKMEDYASS